MLGIYDNEIEDWWDCKRQQVHLLLSPGNPEGHCDYVTRRVTMPEPRATQIVSLAHNLCSSPF
jgi:hypothetical protein